MGEHVTANLIHLGCLYLTVPAIRIPYDKRTRGFHVLKSIYLPCSSCVAVIGFVRSHCAWIHEDCRAL